MGEFHALLSLNSRFVGNVYIIRCSGRVILGDEVKALEAALDAGEREFTRFVVDLSEVSLAGQYRDGSAGSFHAERMSNPWRRSKTGFAAGLCRLNLAEHDEGSRDCYRVLQQRKRRLCLF